MANKGIEPTAGACGSCLAVRCLKHAKRHGVGNMGGPHIDALRISPRFTSKDWYALERHSQDDWAKAAGMVKDRLNGRFLHYAGIQFKTREPFAFPGLWDCWMDRRYW